MTHSMTKINSLCAVLLLLPILTFALTLPEGWIEGKTSHNNLYELKQYIPTGQKVNHFKKIISTTVLKKKLPLSLRALARKERKTLKRAGCDVDINGNYLPQSIRSKLNRRNIAVVYQCKKLSVSGMSLLHQDKDGLFTVYTFEYKTYPLNQLTQQEIANNLAIFYPTTKK